MKEQFLVFFIVRLLMLAEFELFFEFFDFFLLLVDECLSVFEFLFHVGDVLPQVGIGLG